MLTLTWQEYAEWLVSIEGMDLEDAIKKSARLYTKQYNKLINEEAINSFYTERERPMETERAIDTISFKKSFQKERRDRDGRQSRKR